MTGDWNLFFQIINSVEESRRTIILLSSHFLKSMWAKTEFRTAHLKAMEERRARVIIILVGELDDNTELEPELKVYMKANTYVKWGDSWFWEKLRYALNKPLGTTSGFRENLLLENEAMYTVELDSLEKLVVWT
jgi:protein toll